MSATVKRWTNSVWDHDVSNIILTEDMNLIGVRPLRIRSNNCFDFIRW